MDRLTKRNADGTVAYGHNANASNFCDCLDRLAEYEDTGLSPEICAEYKKFEDEAVSKNVTFNRIVELMNAEAEERLIELPCPMSAAIYMVVTKRARAYSKKPFRFVKVSQLTWSNLQSVKHNFGKTVFLLRSEAEKAMERMNKEDEG